MHWSLLVYHKPLYLLCLWCVSALFDAGYHNIDIHSIMIFYNSLVYNFDVQTTTNNNAIIFNCFLNFSFWKNPFHICHPMEMLFQWSAFKLSRFHYKNFKNPTPRTNDNEAIILVMPYFMLQYIMIQNCKKRRCKCSCNWGLLEWLPTYEYDANLSMKIDHSIIVVFEWDYPNLTHKTIYWLLSKYYDFWTKTSIKFLVYIIWCHSPTLVLALFP